MITHATNMDSPQAEHIRNTERARLRALVNGDIAQAEPLHAPEFQLITPIGMPLSKEEYLGAIRSGQIEYLTWEPGAIAVRQHEDHAVIRYRARLEIVFGGHRVAPANIGTLTPMNVVTGSGWWSGRRRRRSATGPRWSV